MVLALISAWFLAVALGAAATLGWQLEGTSRGLDWSQRVGLLAVSVLAVRYFVLGVGASFLGADKSSLVNAVFGPTSVVATAFLMTVAILATFSMWINAIPLP